MKFAAVTPSYNDEDVISGTIKCLKPFVDKHIVLISERPYFGESAPPDRTEEICNDLGAEVIKGYWPLDHHQRNLGIKLCSDVDWIFTFDSDEMMEASEIEKFIKVMEKTDAKAFVCDPVIYWNTPDYRLVIGSGFQPVIAVRPNVGFAYIRNIDSPFQVTDCVMHHLSWSAPKDIYKKVTNYAHATDFDGKKWYRDHYKDWKFGQKAVLSDGLEYDVVYNPLPDELRKHL